MNIDVDAVLIASGLIFAVTMSGLGGLWLWDRHENRAFWREMERRRTDRG